MKLPACVLLWGCSALGQTSPAARWWDHVKYLASDALQGRDTGSPGHRQAARYVARMFQEAGLAPCGTRGYLQPVPLVKRTIREDRSSLEIVRHGEASRWKLGDDAIMSLRATEPGRIDAEAVFVGHGISAPEAGIDDFAGLDLRGKIAVILSGAPSKLSGPLQAHFGSAGERSRAMREAGIIGTLTLPNPKNMDIPWERSVLTRLQPQMAPALAELNDARGLRLAVGVNPAVAERLFAGTGHTWAELLQLTASGKRLPRFALPLRVRTTAAIETSPIQSDNVCGVRPGTGPESVALTAHLDHLGTGGAIAGDSLYNGAMDNASGIATLIESARALATLPRPARGIVFLAVTAEEKGLVGSRYFAHRPTRAAGNIVANINMDMFLPIHPMKSLMVFGLDESSLRRPLESVAARLGLKLLGDPEPQRNRFTRSDQYSFIRRGIPAVALKVGYEKDSPEAAMQKEWTAKRYHAPSDDLQQPVDFEAAATFNRVVAELAAAVANQPERPRWNGDSFFKRFAPPAGEGVSGQ